MASFDAELEDPFDDFEQQYADELEMMNEMEDFDIPAVTAPPISKKTLHFTTPKQKQFTKSVESSPLPVMSGLESPDLGSEVNLASPPLANREAPTLKSKSVDERQISSGDTPTGRSFTENAQERRHSQKRSKENSDLYGLNSSDSDEDGNGELVIVAPFLSPRRKKPRISRKVKRRSPDPAGPEVDDLDDFQITPPPSPDATEKLVMKIQQQRKQKTNDFIVDTVENHVRSGVDVLPRQQNCLLSREPNCPFVTVTGYDGKRMYLKLREDDESARENKKHINNAVIRSERSYNLLSTPIGELREIVEDEKRTQILEESQRVTEQLNRRWDNLFEDDGNEDTATKADDLTKISLWVEKYTPKHYTELLSDDGTNRTLLHWLKLWDCVVFGREKKSKPKNPPEQKKQNKFQKKWQQHDVVEELDEQNRPVHKVALLCGPPGLGKTTLAHVIARHAGYNVVEMNASDDRSPDVFRTKIESATQMKSVLSSDKKPNCLVIDEIDGAPAPAINVLLSVIKKQDGRSDQVSQPGMAAKKKKKDKFVLSRPIICICNDQYVPALRQLRQQAMVVNFPPTLPTRLASRLLEISRENSLETHQTTLLALCNKADNDIRSCINTLQFVRGRHKQFTLNLVHSLSIGQKDQHKGLFSVWQDIFSLPKAKRKRYRNPHEIAVNGGTVLDSDEPSSNETSFSARFNNVYNTVSSNGEYGKLTQGIFENFLDMKFKDPHFEAVVLGHDWLAFNDLLNQEINHSQSYILMRYLPYMPVAFHMLFASSTHHRIQYPNTQYENTVRLNKTTNLLESMLAGVMPNTKRNVNTSIAVLDLLPFLVEILQPNIRPVNTQLFSSKEKEQLSNMVNTMICYNLTYHQERSQDGRYNYVLEPNVEEVIKFSGMAPKKQMMYATKHLISREIDLEKMRRTFKALPTQKNVTGPKTGAKTPTDKGKTPSAVPRHKEKLEPKKIKLPEEERVFRDFFGRIIKKTPSGNGKGNGQQSTRDEGSALYFKFNAGHTNAVRRKVRIQDLL